jgi:hypothetical protein
MSRCGCNPDWFSVSGFWDHIFDDCLSFLQHSEACSAQKLLNWWFIFSSSSLCPHPHRFILQDAHGEAAEVEDCSNPASDFF